MSALILDLIKHDGPAADDTAHKLFTDWKFHPEAAPSCIMSLPTFLPDTKTK